MMAASISRPSRLSVKPKGPSTRPEKKSSKIPLHTRAKTHPIKLAELGATQDVKQGQKNVLAAVDHVAERLGNTRDIARASYISPRVIDHYMEGSVIAYFGERIEELIAAEQGDLTEEEKGLLELLNKKLRCELEKEAA